MATAPPTSAASPTVFQAGASINVLVFILLVPLVLVFRDLSASEGALMDRTCHVLSGLSELVASFLVIHLGAWLVHSKVLPVFGSRWLQHEDLRAVEEWKEKMTRIVVPILVRSECFLFLLPSWEFFSIDGGLQYHATTSQGRCDVHGEGLSALRAFYTARYLLAALMLWELGTFSSGLHWSVLLHHVVTLVACCLTTDTVLLDLLASSSSIADPASMAVGFVTFFYAALTTLEFVLVLFYHLEAGNSLHQLLYMLGAMVTQVVLTSVFFLVLPVAILAPRYESGDSDQISADLFWLLVISNVGMFVVEMFICSIRYRIAAKKWRQYNAEPKGHSDTTVHHAGEAHADASSQTPVELAVTV